MARRVLVGYHSFTCTPTRSSAIGMSHAIGLPLLALPPIAGSLLVYRPQRDGRLSRPWCDCNSGTTSTSGRAVRLAVQSCEWTRIALCCPVSTGQWSVSDWHYNRPRWYSAHSFAWLPGNVSSCFVLSTHINVPCYAPAHNRWGH